MALQIRRGTDAQRQLQRFESGELIYTTDYKDLFVGDGSSNLGGIRIAPVKSVNGLTGSLADGAVTLTTDQIDEGSSNLYYSSTQARIDAGAALVAGNVGNTGISFTYHTNDNSITAVVTAGGYTLPAATPTDLGGVKISQGGLQIDGGGLLSVTTPVAAGTIGQLTYYTGTNAVSQTGAGLKWKTVGDIYPTGGQLTVLGVVESGRIELTKDLTDGGFFLATQSDGSGFTEAFALRSAHNSGSDATAMRLFHSRGTIASPTSIVTGDDIFKLQWVGLTGATSGGVAAEIKATAVGTISGDVVPGRLTLSTADGSGTLVDVLQLDSGGVRTPGFIKVGQVNGSLPSPAEEGMIVLDGTTFKGYAGGVWIDLN